jgi:hypothetical protein
MESADERSERMGAGYVLGDQPEPILTFHARVGGPLATTRAEAESILKLLQDVRMHKGHGVNLLVFVDCLVVLDILANGDAPTSTLIPRRWCISTSSATS